MAVHQGARLHGPVSHHCFCCPRVHTSPCPQPSSFSVLPSRPASYSLSRHFQLSLSLLCSQTEYHRLGDLDTDICCPPARGGESEIDLLGLRCLPAVGLRPRGGCGSPGEPAGSPLSPAEEAAHEAWLTRKREGRGFGGHACEEASWRPWPLDS